MLLLAEAGRSLNKDLTSLFKHNFHTPRVLERLVHELHSDKELCSYLFLNHPGSEDMLWGLMNLLTEDSRTAGNASYVIGTLAETDLGKRRIVQICTDKGDQAKKILPALTNMLDMVDTETVMNAAGTMGTLAEDGECRLWMLKEDCLDEAIVKLTYLLSSKDMCTASNAALVLARLTIAEEGCARILNHRSSSYILVQLTRALGIDETGRGMNAAFAIGRLCDFEAGCKRMLFLKTSELMINSLIDMLHASDSGCCKNACFALSCIASLAQGHQRLLEHIRINSVVEMLCSLLASKDEESIWFASMMLHTLASQKRGCLYLRTQHNVENSLEVLLQRPHLKEDTKEEAEATAAILEKLLKPKPPNIKVESAYCIIVTWDAIHPKSGLDVTYLLFKDGVAVYSGSRTSYIANDLTPVTRYSFYLQASTEGDDSPFSNVVSFVTPESVPSAPQCLRVLSKSTSQIKIFWEPPATSNGVLRGYQIVARGKTSSLDVHENYFILSSVPPDTECTFQVFAMTSKGRGEPAVVTASTDDLASHAPPKPLVQVLGRHELLISWESPPKPLGRINSFEVRVDGMVIYNGVEKSCTAKSLKPNTEYTITVSAWCSEGRCESVPAKKRTAREVYTVIMSLSSARRHELSTVHLPSNPLCTASKSSTRQRNARSSATTKTSASASSAAVSSKNTSKSKTKAPTRKPLYPYETKNLAVTKQEKVLRRAKTVDVLRVPSRHSSQQDTRGIKGKRNYDGVTPENNSRPFTTFNSSREGLVNGSPQSNKKSAGRKSKSQVTSVSRSLESLEKDNDDSKERVDLSESSSFSSVVCEVKERRAVSDSVHMDVSRKLTKHNYQSTGSASSPAKDKSRKSLSVARRSSLPSSGSPQRSPKSATPQLPSRKDSRDVKRSGFPSSQKLTRVTNGVASLQVTHGHDEKPPKPPKKTQFAASFDELRLLHRETSSAKEKSATAQAAHDGKGYRT